MKPILYVARTNNARSGIEKVLFNTEKTRMVKWISEGYRNKSRWRMS